MTKVRTVEGTCPDCGEHRPVKLYYSHSSPISRCSDCIRAQKDRAFHAAREKRS